MPSGYCIVDGVRNFQTVRCVPFMAAMHPRQCAGHRLDNEYDRIGDDCVVVNGTNDIHHNDGVASTCKWTETIGMSLYSSHADKYNPTFEQG